MPPISTVILFGMDFPVTILVVHDAGWWQLKYIFDVHPYFGEDDPI